MFSDPAVRRNLQRAFERFLTFLGLTWDWQLVKSIAPVEKNFVWTTENHNWLRITRVLRCLKLADMKPELEHFWAFRAYGSGAGLAVSEHSFGHWQRAVGGKVG